MFDGRAAEAFPYLLAALKYFETTHGRESLDALVMRADVAFAYGCTTEKNWPVAVSTWKWIRERLATRDPAEENNTVAMLIDHMACDELIAQAYHANLRVEKASMLNRAFYIGSKIRHPYLMKIIVELEVLGIFIHDSKS